MLAFLKKHRIATALFSVVLLSASATAPAYALACIATGKGASECADVCKWTALAPWTFLPCL